MSSDCFRLNTRESSKRQSTQATSRTPRSAARRRGSPISSSSHRKRARSCWESSRSRRPSRSTTWKRCRSGARSPGSGCRSTCMCPQTRWIAHAGLPPTCRSIWPSSGATPRLAIRSGSRWFIAIRRRSRRSRHDRRNPHRRRKLHRHVRQRPIPGHAVARLLPPRRVPRGVLRRQHLPGASRHPLPRQRRHPHVAAPQRRRPSPRRARPDHKSAGRPPCRSCA